MRAVVQRVTKASVTVDGEIVASIDRGAVVLVGVAAGDSAADVEYLASKVSGLRIFPDEAGKMNRSLTEVGGQALVISQFTLLGDVRRGRRPAFDAAEAPDKARLTYEVFVEALRATGVAVASGRFQAHMDVAIVNDGPVTILIDSRRAF